MNRQVSLYEEVRRTFSSSTNFNPNHLELLKSSNFPNRKADIITDSLIQLCYINNVLYIKTCNNRLIEINANLSGHIFWITSLLLETVILRHHFMDNKDFNILFKKSFIEEICPNIIGCLQRIESTPIPVESFDEENAIECSICLQNRTEFNRTDCNHFFCTSCVNNFRNNTCPLCRANMFSRN